jgi:hypothetical protein
MGWRAAVLQVASALTNVCTLWLFRRTSSWAMLPPRLSPTSTTCSPGKVSSSASMSSTAAEKSNLPVDSPWPRRSGATRRKRSCRAATWGPRRGGRVWPRGAGETCAASRMGGHCCARRPTPVAGRCRGGRVKERDRRPRFVRPRRTRRPHRWKLRHAAISPQFQGSRPSKPGPPRSPPRRRPRLPRRAGARRPMAPGRSSVRHVAIMLFSGRPLRTAGRRRGGRHWSYAQAADRTPIQGRRGRGRPHAGPLPKRTSPSNWRRRCRTLLDRRPADPGCRRGVRKLVKRLRP